MSHGRREAAARLRGAVNGRQISNIEKRCGKYQK
jgi:hypothetical protein